MPNFYDILNNVCVLAHEEKPTSFAVSDSPYSEIKQYINDILEEVCSKYNWTFRERTFTLSTVVGQREYDLPSGVTPSGIIQNSVRIGGNLSPLYYMIHSDLDSVAQASGKPFRYSIYANKLILDSTPDAVYSLTVKYLTVNFAYNIDDNDDNDGDGATVEKPNLALETDLTIIPDRFIKVIEWGAYSLYRQNFKPDEKYSLARAKYIEFLLGMQKQDSHSGDSAPLIVINQNLNPTQQILKDFFRP